MVGLLAACGLSRPAPVKQTYLLQPQPPAQAANTPRQGTLKVGAIAVAAQFRGKDLVYRETDLKYEADFYNEFFVAPSAMLTESAATWLAAARVFNDVLPSSANANGDYVLEGFVSELYGDYRDAAKPAALLSAKFFLIDGRNVSGVPVWQTELTQRVALSGRGPDQLAAALSSAWAAILNDLARQLAAVQLPAKELQGSTRQQR
ncbi:MAG TPA: ABC-type transport auxiliary lipoprotein family protein [Casimicrobiaceae bacterium]|nr:ABC-type transport auxiliary lipoprotein family protein [Casimicrobiaceae bacterium]